jgi:MoxR-like ATPase
MAKKEKVYEVIGNVKREGNRLKVYEIVTGEPIIEKIPYGAKHWALKDNLMIGKQTSKAGNVFWRKIKPVDVPDSYRERKSNPGEIVAGDNSTNEYRKPTDDEVRLGVQNAYSKKPKELVLDSLNWRLATRALLRGENIIFIGASGGGKTLTARTLAKVYNRPFFKFNLGAMSDARTSLIGNTHYNPDKGTFFAASDFVKAIQTPGACILLDEMTRMSNDAENILLTPLDADQRYLRIDENPDAPVVEVAEGVCFFATANIGTEYTSTRTIDRATRDRFTTIVDIPLLTETQEYDLLKYLYPEVNKELLKGIAEVAWFTREDVMGEEPKLSTIVSTRSTVEQVALLVDGFRFTEVMEAIVIPLYDKEGGVESEQAYMRSMIQGKSHLDKVATFPKAAVISDAIADELMGDDAEEGDLFGDDDIMAV